MTVLVPFYQIHFSSFGEFSDLFMINFGFGNSADDEQISQNNFPMMFYALPIGIGGVSPKSNDKYKGPSKFQGREL